MPILLGDANSGHFKNGYKVKLELSAMRLQEQDFADIIVRIFRPKSKELVHRNLPRVVNNGFRAI